MLIIAILRVIFFSGVLVALLAVKKTRFRFIPARRTRISRHHGETTLWLERLVNAVLDMWYCALAAEGAGSGSVKASSSSASPHVTATHHYGAPRTPERSATPSPFSRVVHEAVGNDGEGSGKPHFAFLATIEERVNALLEDSGIAAWSDFRIVSLGDRPPRLKAIYVIPGGSSSSSSATTNNPGPSTAANASAGGVGGAGGGGMGSLATTPAAAASGSPGLQANVAAGGGGGSADYGAAKGASSVIQSHGTAPVASTAAGGGPVMSASAAAVGVGGGGGSDGAAGNGGGGGGGGGVNVSNSAAAAASAPVGASAMMKEYLDGVGLPHVMQGPAPPSSSSLSASPANHHNTAAATGSSSPSASGNVIGGDGSSHPAASAPLSGASATELEMEVEYSGGVEVSLRADFSFARGRQLPVFIRAGEVRYFRAHLRVRVALEYEAATLEQTRKPFLRCTVWLESDPTFDLTLHTSLTKLGIEDCFLVPVLARFVLLRFLRKKMRWPSAEGISFNVPLPAGVVDGGEQTWANMMASGMAETTAGWRSQR